MWLTIDGLKIRRFAKKIISIYYVALADHLFVLGIFDNRQSPESILRQIGEQLDGV